MKAVIKENICVKGSKIRCGSHMLENFISPYDATVVERLKENGVDIIGTANMDEFGMGSTTETSYYGVTENPVVKGYVAGGSSGGCAASVKNGECDFALGSDTGGSIRLPASHCGIVGLKPTYGTVSRYGLVSYASSMDVIGPMAADIDTVAKVFDMIMGKDERDSTSIDFPLEKIESTFTNKKVGVPYKWLDEGVDEAVKRAVNEACDRFVSSGYTVEEIDIKCAEYVVPTYYVIACAEASSNLSRYDGVKYGYRAEEYAGLHDMYKRTRTEGFGEEVKKRIMLGTYVLSEGFYDEYYIKAAKVRRLITNEYIELFKKYDMILTPVSPVTAPKIGEMMKNPIAMYKSDLFTVSANLTGMPALSIPFGTDDKGLPIGIQLMGNYFTEKQLCSAGVNIYE